MLTMWPSKGANPQGFLPPHLTKRKCHNTPKVCFPKHRVAQELSFYVHLKYSQSCLKDNLRRETSLKAKIVFLSGTLCFCCCTLMKDHSHKITICQFPWVVSLRKFYSISCFIQNIIVGPLISILYHIFHHQFPSFKLISGKVIYIYLSKFVTVI